MTQTSKKGETAQERFDHYRNKPDEKPDTDVIARLKGTHVVLIGGLGSSAMNGLEKAFGVAEGKRYFGNFKKVLESHGITATIHHPETETIEASAQKLLQLVPKLYREGGDKPLVLVGHSRGGLVATRVLLDAPVLLEKNVIAKAVTLQSPVNGNALDDLSTWAMARAGTGWMKPEGNFGLKALETESIQKTMGEAFARLPAGDQKRVSDAVVWVTGTTDASDSFFERTNARTLTERAGPNDAFVALRDQRREDYGTLGAYFNDLSHKQAVFVDDSLQERRRNNAFVHTMMEIMSENLAGLKKSAGLEEKSIAAALSKWRRGGTPQAA